MIGKLRAWWIQTYRLEEFVCRQGNCKRLIFQFIKVSQTRFPFNSNSVSWAYYFDTVILLVYFDISRMIKRFNTQHAANRKQSTWRIFAVQNQKPSGWKSAHVQRLQTYQRGVRKGEFEETDVVVNDDYCINGHAIFLRLSLSTMFALRLSVVRLKGGMFLVKEAINDLLRSFTVIPLWMQTFPHSSVRYGTGICSTRNMFQRTGAHSLLTKYNSIKYRVNHPLEKRHSSFWSIDFSRFWSRFTWFELRSQIKV